MFIWGMYEMEKYKELLYLARATLESWFKDREVDIPEDVKKKYSEKGACFVTLTKNNELRGCIGSLIAVRSLYEDVIDNAVNAAFHDPRFPELGEEELDDIKVEISVLSKPERLGKGKEVFDKINKNMGIVLNYKGRSSTFLPQVWEQIPDKELFLEHLAMKAGLFRDDWKESDIDYYRVEKVEE